MSKAVTVSISPVLLIVGEKSDKSIEPGPYKRTAGADEFMCSTYIIYNEYNTPEIDCAQKWHWIEWFPSGPIKDFSVQRSRLDWWCMCVSSLCLHHYIRFSDVRDVCVRVSVCMLETVHVHQMFYPSSSLWSWRPRGGTSKLVEGRVYECLDLDNREFRGLSEDDCQNENKAVNI